MVLGVAALIGDRWIQVGMGALRLAKTDPEGRPLIGSIDGGGKVVNFKIELKAPR